MNFEGIFVKVRPKRLVELRVVELSGDTSIQRN